jgi:exosortase A-associated hydrolase 2
MSDAEEMFFFEGGGRRLLGFYHAPRPSGGKPRGVLYCHPFAEERNLSHAIAARAARRLAAKGIAVLRFDFSGCGDSEGDLEQATVPAWLEEIAAAAEVLKRKADLERFGVWGLRSGANLAARFCAGRADVDSACLWQPVADLKLFATQFLRQKVASGLAGEGQGGSVGALVKKLEAGEIVEVMGYPVSLGLYKSLVAPGSALAGLELPCPACVVSVSEAEEPVDAYPRLAGALRTPEGPARLLHVRETPFWDRYWRWEAPAIEDRTAEWIGSAAAG